MTDIDLLAHDKWEGAAQTFCNTVRKANRLLITTSSPQQSALSVYGRRGYGPHYSDHLDRIDSAIAILERSRRLFLEAESLREKVERNT